VGFVGRLKTGDNIELGQGVSLGGENGFKRGVWAFPGLVVVGGKRERGKNWSQARTVLGGVTSKGGKKDSIACG